MAGTLSVQKIQGLATSATPSVVEIASGHKLSGAAGSIVAPGHVIQVQTQSIDTQSQITSTSFVTTNMSVNITPKFSSSLIFITSCINLYKNAAGTNVWLTIYKDSTNLGHSTYGMGEFSGLGAAGGQFAQVQINNSPSTTSQVTYAVYTRVTNGGNVYIQSNNCLGNITAMEIAQ